MHAMNELQRQRYLSALGVESYAPRWLLPGAPEPVLCTRLPVAAAEGEPEPANLPADAQPGAASSDVSAELRTLSGRVPETRGERKSTRLNSSHVAISYAGFCLQKKNERTA